MSYTSSTEKVDKLIDQFCDFSVLIQIAICVSLLVNSTWLLGTDLLNIDNYISATQICSPRAKESRQLLLGPTSFLTFFHLPIFFFLSNRQKFGTFH